MNKRVFDLFISLILIIILSPLILFLSIIVKLKFGLSPVFKQIRPGKNTRPFIIYKFRTMLELKDKEGNLLPDEKRLTGFGQFLRKTSLDELPELFNVLRGDMSLVGPRPLLIEYLPLYNERQRKRHLMRPGITGWAQVNGRNLISWEEKFDFDVWYVENWSFWLDIKIMFFTFLNVLTMHGISSKDHVTMERFRGYGREKYE